MPFTRQYAAAQARMLRLIEGSLSGTRLMPREVVLGSADELTEFVNSHWADLRAAFPPPSWFATGMSRFQLNEYAHTAFGKALQKGPVTLGDMVVSLAPEAEEPATLAAE